MDFMSHDTLSGLNMLYRKIYNHSTPTGSEIYFA